MNATARDFLRWKSAPPVAPPPAAPTPAVHYPHTGWLSASETTKQRMERLIEAHVVRKEILSEADFNWMVNNAAKDKGWAKRRDQEVIGKDMRTSVWLNHNTRSISGGFQSS